MSQNAELSEMAKPFTGPLASEQVTRRDERRHVSVEDGAKAFIGCFDRDLERFSRAISSRNRS